MDLSVDLIKEFAKITNDESVINEGSTVYGKYILQGDEAFVEIDGSDGTLTPVATTSTAKNNDRVTVLIKDHTAIVTGNLTDPSASSEEVEDVKKQMGTTALDIEELKKQLENQEITMQEYDDAIAEAKRKATDYIDFTAGTGLVIGSSTISNNVRIYSGGVDIREGETILASYTDNKIYLGKENKNASIDLCAGTATIYGDFTDIEESKLYIETGSDLCLWSIGGAALIGNEYHSLGVDFSGIFFNTRQGQTLSYIQDERIRLGMTVSSRGPYMIMDIADGGKLYGDWYIQGYYKKGDSPYFAKTRIIPGTASVDTCYLSTTTSDGGYRLLGTTDSLRAIKNSITEDLSKDENLNPEKLYDLPVVLFKYNEGYYGDEVEYDYDQYEIGFIAEDMDKFYPKAAIYRDGKLASWTDRNLIPPMIKLIQNHKKEIDALKVRIAELENKEVSP
jgi:hypothetical protein